MNIRSFGIVVALLLAGCGGDDAPEKNQGAPAKVYRHSLNGAPTSLDPVQAATVYANHVVTNVYDTLYAYKYLARPYELKTNLAAGLPEISEDGLSYTIGIKPGVRFIDDPAFPEGKGREVTAEDFVYSIKRHFDPQNRSQGAWLWQGKILGLDAWKEQGSDYAAAVPGLTAVDRYTVRIRLTEPYPQLVHTLAQGFSAVVPGEAVEHYGRELSVHPVGSGPFAVKSFDTAKIVMMRNEGYRKEPIDLAAEGFDEALHGPFGLARIEGRIPPLVDQLEIHFVNEASSRWNSFTKGNEIQFSGIPIEQVDQVLAQKKPEVVLKPEYAERYFMNHETESGFVHTDFNMRDPEIGYNEDPVRNARNTALRCAIRSAFNWEERNERFYSGLGVIFPGIIPPVTPEYDPEMSRESLRHDPDAGRTALAEAGWTDETLPELDYGGVASVVQRQFFEQFRGWLTAIGYPKEKVTYNSFATFGDFNKAVKQAQIKIIGMGWGLDYPDAQNTLQLFYGPNGSPGSNNSNYDNPEYNRLYEMTSTMQPSDERTALYRQMNQMVIDDCVTISGISRENIMLWHKDVISYPDQQIVGGFHLKYVEVATPAERTE